MMPFHVGQKGMMGQHQSDWKSLESSAVTCLSPFLNATLFFLFFLSISQWPSVFTVLLKTKFLLTSCAWLFLTYPLSHSTSSSSCICLQKVKTLPSSDTGLGAVCRQAALLNSKGPDSMTLLFTMQGVVYHQLNGDGKCKE